MVIIARNGGPKNGVTRFLRAIQYIAIKIVFIYYSYYSGINECDEGVSKVIL
jgi:hypothetical protein